ARPPAAARPLGDVPRPGRSRDDAARLEPRDGRGRALRPDPVAPRRPPARGGAAGRAAFSNCCRGSRRRVPAPGAGSRVSVRATGATAARVLRQLRHDPRTVALLLLVPALLLALLKGIFSGQPETFDRVGAPLLGLFPFISMFVVTAIAMLRERLSGTLGRLLTMPLAKADILFGYGVAFGLMAVIQVGVVSGVGFGLLDLEVAHSTLLVVALAVGNALLGMALGLFVSAFAATEFQAVQFVPAFITPQLLLSGLFVPREQMSDVLEAISWALPLTYAYDALARVARPGALGPELVRDVLVVAGATVLALLLGALTLRRRTS